PYRPYPSRGRGKYEDWMKQFRSGFSNFQCDIDELIDDGMRVPFDGPGVELTAETCWESLLPIGKSSSPKRICFGFPEAVSPKITFPRTSWICWISLGRLNSRRPRLKRVRFLGEVEMKERISMWEGEGGSVSETSGEAMTGTVNQIEIRTQVN